MLFLAIPISLAVGCLLALYFFYLLDQRIHDGDHIEERFGVKVWTSLQDLSDKQPHGAAPLSPACIACMAYCRWSKWPSGRPEHRVDLGA